MSSIVAAAIVSVSGTVVVGVAGFGASIWNARKSVAHARESRVWDRRADVYIDMLAAVSHRQISLGYAVRITPAGIDPLGQRARAYLDSRTPPDWSVLEARLQAFASEPVYTAVQASSTAHNLAMLAYENWMKLGGRAADIGDADRARAVAEAADDAVVELIRTELQGKGKPLGDWQAFGLPDAHQDHPAEDQQAADGA